MYVLSLFCPSDVIHARMCGETENVFIGECKKKENSKKMNIKLSLMETSKSIFLFVCYLGLHAKFHIPRLTPSGKKD